MRFPLPCAAITMLWVTRFVLWAHLQLASADCLDESPSAHKGARRGSSWGEAPAAEAVLQVPCSAHSVFSAHPPSPWRSHPRPHDGELRRAVQHAAADGGGGAGPRHPHLKRRSRRQSAQDGEWPPLGQQRTGSTTLARWRHQYRLNRSTRSMWQAFAAGMCAGRCRAAELNTQPPDFAMPAKLTIRACSCFG